MSTKKYSLKGFPLKKVIELNISGCLLFPRNYETFLSAGLHFIREGVAPVHQQGDMNPVWKDFCILKPDS